MITKEKLIEHIQKFPEQQFSMEELIERLLFIAKLEARIEKSENDGTAHSHQAIKDEIKKWSK